eukprot:snap_masked-scaffold_73-processed-gene-0.15-mRNA-1 protein AED:0.93 eAED:1.00 QI:0/-1/0/1/-1/1/1/0/1252
MEDEKQGFEEEKVFEWLEGVTSNVTKFMDVTETAENSFHGCHCIRVESEVHCVGQTVVKEIVEKMKELEAYFDNFKAEPSVIDSSLEKVLGFIFSLVTKMFSLENQQILSQNKDNEELLNKRNMNPHPFEIIHSVFSLIYVISKIRGLKVIIPFFPNSTEDMHLVLSLLRSQNLLLAELNVARVENVVDKPENNWKTVYGLFLWLAALSLLPFSFCVLGKTVETQILDLCTSNLSLRTPVSQASAFCLARMFLRTELMGSFSSFLDQLTLQIFGLGEQSDAVTAEVYNKLKVVCYVLKLGLPEKVRIERQLVSLCEAVHGVDSNAISFKAVRVQILKFGGTFILREQLPMGEELELIIESLLISLNDASTIVRWKSSKAIAEICEKLEQEEFVEQIVDNLVFTLEQDDAAGKHGSLLCLSQMLRSCALQLVFVENDAEKIFLRSKRLLDLVSKACVYEKRIGYQVLGENVRDAACFFYWSLSRTKTFLCANSKDVYNIIIRLSLISILDREIASRKAGAAALQEVIGRCEKSGYTEVEMERIMLLGELINFFDVGNRKMCYETITFRLLEMLKLMQKKVSKNDNVYQNFINTVISHLSEKMLVHWDVNMRMLASKSLAGIISTFQTEIIDDSVVKFYEQACSGGPVERHGALLYLFHILGNHNLMIHSDSLVKLCTLPEVYDKKRLYRGRITELVRKSLLQLTGAIYELAMAQSLVLPKAKKILVSIYEGLSKPSDDVQEAARVAMKFYLQYKASVEDVEQLRKNMQKTVKKLVQGLGDTNVAIRRGYALGLSSIPYQCLQTPVETIGTVIDVLAVKSIRRGCRYNTELINRFHPNELQHHANHFGKPYYILNYTEVDCKEVQDVNFRCNCVSAIKHIVQFYILEETLSLDFREIIVSKFIIISILALHDYEVDRRGDVGSWARKNAIGCIGSLLSNGGIREKLLLNEYFPSLVNAIVKQVFERQESLRLGALKLLKQIEDIDEASSLHTEKNNTYHDCLVLFGRENLLPSVMEGLVGSLADLSKYVSESSREALVKVFQTHPDIYSPLQLCSDFVVLLLKYSGDEKKVSSIFKALGIVLELLPTQCDLSVDKKRQLLAIAKHEFGNGSNTEKAKNIIEVLPYILNCDNPDVNTNLFRIYLNALSSKYPVIRKVSADSLYLALVPFSRIPFMHNNPTEAMEESDILEDIKNLVLTSEWQKLNASEARITTRKLASLIGITPRTHLAREEEKEVENTEAASYQALIRDLERGL